MAQLTSHESQRAASRIEFINKMRTNLIGSPRADEFNRKFSKVITWQVTNVSSEMIDALESELREWLGVNNGQAH